MDDSRLDVHPTTLSRFRELATYSFPIYGFLSSDLSPEPDV
jgi:hypothetical protein